MGAKNLKNVIFSKVCSKFFQFPFPTTLDHMYGMSNFGILEFCSGQISANISNGF